MGQVEVEWTYRKQGGDSTLGKNQTEPVQEDFFQHIYNVQWITGGIFIGGNGIGDVFYSEIRTTKEEEQAGAQDVIKTTFSKATPFGYYDGYNDSASAIVDGEAVFVLVGNYSGRGGGPYDGGSGAVIIASRDGKSWSRVLDKPNEFHNIVGDDAGLRGNYWIDRNFIGVVWDAGEERPEGGPRTGMFYAVAFRQKLIWPGGFAWQANDITVGNELFSSRDGFSWSSIGEQMYDQTNDVGGGGNPATPLPLETPSMIAPHCTKPNNDGQIPDGFQGYSKGIDTFVGPVLHHPGFNLWGIFYPEGGATNRIVIKANVEGGIAGGISPGPESETVSAPCNAVALAGQAFVAAGGGGSGDSAYASIDVALAPENPTGPSAWQWKNAFHQNGTSPIFTITGLPRSAVKVKIKSDVSGGQGEAPPSTPV